MVCPASLKENWRREFLKWGTKGLSVEVVKKQFPTTNVVILNYESLRKWRSQLRSRVWDLIVSDEAHFVKNSKTIRARELLGGIKRNEDKKIIDKVSPIPAKRRLFLTGTPILSKPKDLWPLLQKLDPEGLGSDWFAFAKRYCELFEITRFNPAKGKEEQVGWKWDGASHLDELQDLMRQRFMIRRLKKDVLTELPPKTRQIIVLEAKKSLTKLLNRETLLYDDYVAKNGDVTSEPPEFTNISKIRKEVALAKIPYVVEYIKEVLNDQAKVVVFGHHKETIEILQNTFSDCCVTISGETASHDRQKAVDKFQNDAGCKVFIGSIHAAGTGLTLTASSLCIFVEQDWTPAVISQCEDRLHRIGQVQNVLVQHIVLAGSLDERIVQTIIKKQEIADKTLDKEIK